MCYIENLVAKIRSHKFSFLLSILFTIWIYTVYFTSILPKFTTKTLTWANVFVQMPEKSNEIHRIPSFHFCSVYYLPFGYIRYSLHQFYQNLLVKHLLGQMCSSKCQKKAMKSTASFNNRMYHTCNQNR